MTFITTLPHNIETYFEMKQLCSNWERVSNEKIQDPSMIQQEKLFKRYVAVKNVCEYSFYRFRKARGTFINYNIDITYDNNLNITGFALSKIITTKDTINPRRFLFLHYMTSDPNQFEVSTRTKNLGNSILGQLKKRCIDQNLDGIFSEPVLSAIPFFHAHKFVDTPIRRSHRSAVLLPVEDFD